MGDTPKERAARDLYATAPEFADLRKSMDDLYADAVPPVEAYKREWETFSHEPWEVQLADAAIARLEKRADALAKQAFIQQKRAEIAEAAIAALEAESASRDEAVRRALAFIAPGGYDEELARRVLTDPILYAFAYVADRVLKEAKDKERCGNCKHWRYTEIDYCMLDNQERRPWAHCHFNPSRWELCDG
uniref:Uncharacterized protein n=2 Tax=viral metagenome TaxID=1070528 RepID=A0A6M3IL02_9ZZZZ